MNEINQVMNRTSRVLAAAVAMAVSSLFEADQAQAASATWSASPTSGDWVAAAGQTNWNTGDATFPGSTSGTTNNADVATFLTSSTASVSLGQALNLKSIVFGDGTNAPSNFTIGTLGGSAISLTHGGNIGYAVGNPTFASPVTQTINAPLILLPASGTTAGAYSFNVATNPGVPTNASLTVAGSITGGTTTAGITLTLSRSTLQSTLSGIISDGTAASGLALSQAASVNGNWKISGDNTYTGKTSILGGTMEVSSLNSVATNETLGTVHAASSSLGAPTTVANGTIDLGINSSNATLKYVGGGETTDRVINFSAATTNRLDASGTGALVFTSNFTVGSTSADAGKILVLAGTSTASNELRGILADGASQRKVSVSKTGDGTWALWGANTYTGTTSVTGGTLLVNGSLASASAVTVNNSAAILGGGGNIAGPVTITAGTLAPGNSQGILGVGNLTISANGTNLNMDIVGAGYDQANVTGTVTLGSLASGPTLNLALGAAPTATQYTLINNDGTDAVSGVFKGLAQGATITATYGAQSYNFVIDYAGGTGNDVVLSIPEPAAVSLVAATGLLLTARRRRVA